MKVQAPDHAVRLASTAGVTLHLAAREVREVPPFMVAAAFEVGCTPADGNIEPSKGGPDPVGPDKGERESLIQQAVERLVERGAPGDFTKTDPPRPRKAAVEKEAGTTVSANEINEAYALVTATEAGNADEGE